MPKPHPNTERQPETAAEFFRHHNGNARAEDLHTFLEMVHDAPPQPGDKLPSGF